MSFHVNSIMEDLFGMEKSGAEFSPCGKYRYALWRIWDKELPIVAFIGLNPSTANALKDDPTIRRVKGFAKKWGFGGVYMMNLFGIISPDPTILVKSADPIGECDKWLRYPTKKIHTVVFAWGSFKEAKHRAKDVIAMFPEAVCLKKTSDGSPSHPLYIPSDTVPIHFKNDYAVDLTPKCLSNY